MGGSSSKSSTSYKGSARVNTRISLYGASGREFQAPELEQSNTQDELRSPSQVRRGSKKAPEEEPKQIRQTVSMGEMGMERYGSTEDYFYDGIPRFPGSLSQNSTATTFNQATVGKASPRSGRASTFGFGKAVDVLDALGSSMTNLNSRSGFDSGPSAKGSELSILAFEVANTIVKGSSLVQSLSKRSIRTLKEVVIPSEGVQNLVSKDEGELLRTVADDKRDELKIFSGEVVRFGNRCKDPQWHNLNRYFEKTNRGLATPKHSEGSAELAMQQLMTLVQCTAELYQEMSILDRLEEDLQKKRQEGGSSISIQKGNEVLALLAQIKRKSKQVKDLKKKSLWSRSMEEVMENLVEAVVYVNREIQNAFGNTFDSTESSGHVRNQNKLGPSGLALHYAHVVLLVDSTVAQSSSMPLNLRDTLYQNLPPNVKSSLCSKLRSFRVEKLLSIEDIKDELEKTLRWLAPLALNTAKAYHGFGWVGEWANAGSVVHRTPVGINDVFRIETLHHADKGRTDVYILELLPWLNHLTSQHAIALNNGKLRPPIKKPVMEEINRSGAGEKLDGSRDFQRAESCASKEGEGYGCGGIADNKDTDSPSFPAVNLGLGLGKDWT